MKKLSKILCLILMVIIAPCVIFFAGCSENGVVSILSIKKTDTQGIVDTYTITYTDGSTSTFTITNGKDGKNGLDGKDGENAKSTLHDVYEEYINLTGSDITYEQFLTNYANITDDTSLIDTCLLSVLKIYTEFKVNTMSYVSTGGGISLQQIKTKAISGGAGVVYKINDDYTYVITNYHVVYNNSAVPGENGKISSKIIGYLYGSEGIGKQIENVQDDEGYPVYDYGTMALEFEYVGGSVEKDLALIRIPTDTILARNNAVRAVQLADSYRVGETAVAIGNPEGYGISVTKGIVSVDSEYIALAIDGTARYYRTLRMDTSIYHGSSGGGLFNESGELIGITNAGNEEDESINYAIPLSTVKTCISDILYYALDDDENTNGVYKVVIGITTTTEDSRYVYNQTTKTGRIVETIKITEVIQDSIASRIGIQTNEILYSIIVNDAEIIINRGFELGDVLIELKAGDVIKIKTKQGNNYITSSEYTVLAEDLVSVA